MGCHRAARDVAVASPPILCRAWVSKAEPKIEKIRVIGENLCFLGWVIWWEMTTFAVLNKSKKGLSIRFCRL